VKVTNQKGKRRKTPHTPKPELFSASLFHIIICKKYALHVNSKISTQTLGAKTGTTHAASAHA